MQSFAAAFTREEIVTLSLRRLFTQYGYSRFRMGKFEAYDMYRENKAFLKSDGIITFTDSSGRLMALKPDVTMSIVKNTPKDATVRKLYYSENVFRLNPHDGEYREISQTGIEFIGGQSAYAQAEVLALAAGSLGIISTQYVLNLSHMGYITALLDTLQLTGQAAEQAMQALAGKNEQALRTLAAENGLTGKGADSLIALASLGGTFPAALEKAKALCICPEMQAACAELAEVYTALQTLGVTALRLDFSIVNDVDYYNGIIFQGFVPGVPRAVLAGGRYDKLLRRFGKGQAALGFALYLGELSRSLVEKPQFNVDIVLLYKETQPAAMVAAAVQQLAQSGTVRAECNPLTNVRAARTFVLLNDGSVKEAQPC